MAPPGGDFNGLVAQAPGGGWPLGRGCPIRRERVPQDRHGVRGKGRESRRTCVGEVGSVHALSPLLLDAGQGAFDARASDLDCNVAPDQKRDLADLVDDAAVRILALFGAGGRRNGERQGQERERDWDQRERLRTVHRGRPTARQSRLITEPRVPTTSMGGLDVSEARKLRELERENAELK
jgi:hypothetical protein